MKNPATNLRQTFTFFFHNSMVPHFVASLSVVCVCVYFSLDWFFVCRGSVCNVSKTEGDFMFTFGRLFILIVVYSLLIASCAPYIFTQAQFSDLGIDFTHISLAQFHIFLTPPLSCSPFLYLSAPLPPFSFLIVPGFFLTSPVSSKCMRIIRCVFVCLFSLCSPFEITSETFYSLFPLLLLRPLFFDSARTLFLFALLNIHIKWHKFTHSHNSFTKCERNQQIVSFGAKVWSLFFYLATATC